MLRKTPIATQNPEPTDANDSDATLLDRYRRGDEDAATHLYHRYAERLRHVAQKHIAADLTARVDDEDVLQSAFRSFFRRAAEGQYSVSPGEELWKLLLVIALNKARNLGKHHRAKKRDVRSTERPEPLAQLAGGHEAGTDAYQELHLLLSELLESLPDAQQRIIQLRLEGHEVSVIAAESRRSKRTVERILHDFRNELHRLLHEDDAT